MEEVLWHLALMKKLRVRAIAPDMVEVSYSVLDHTLLEIERRLAEHGYELDESLPQRLQRAWFHYCESVQRENLLQPERLIKQSQQAYVTKAQQHPRGDHDPTPEPLREYH